VMVLSVSRCCFDAVDS